MKSLILSFFTILAVFCLTLDTNAQGFGCNYNVDTGQWERPDGGPCINTIITAVPFLRIVPDARSGAMGDVGIAITPDPNSIHFNNSNLAFVDKDLSISATYTPWLRALGLQDIYMAYLTGYKKFDEFQTLGVGLRYFSLGDIQFTNSDGEPIGNGRPNEFELNIAYARKLGNNFSAGMGVKYIYSALANGQSVDGFDIGPGRSFAADFSMTYHKPIKLGEKDARFTSALSITNIGPKISYTNSVNRDFIPTNMGLGASLDVDIDDFNTFLIAADINKLLVPTPAVPAVDENPKDGILDYKQVGLMDGITSSFGDAPGGGAEELRELMYSVGLEYWYDKQFAVRAGYYHEDQTKGNRQFATVGLGLKYNIFGLNLSYLIPLNGQRNPLDNTLRFSLLFDFGAFEGGPEN